MICPNELGVAWLLQAVHDPPQSVVFTKKAEVVINKLTPKTSTANAALPVVASQATVELCASVPPAVDPWLKQDPWQSGVNKLPAVKPHAADAMMQLKDVESRLEKSLLDKLTQSTDVSMIDQKIQVHQNGTDARLSALEP